jgi:hypothetical protein
VRATPNNFVQATPVFAFLLGMSQVPACLRASVSP